LCLRGSDSKPLPPLSSQQVRVARGNQAAHAAAHTKNTYLSAQYHRLAGRRGQKKAVVAVSHSILVIAYHMIQRKEPYNELGGDYFYKHRVEASVKHLVKQMEFLGFSVSLGQASSRRLIFYFQVGKEIY
jgi:hypothetical protein